MHAIILAGGKGTRLHPVTRDRIPKPMTRIYTKPVLEHIMEGLNAHGVDQFTIATSHLGSAIRDYFGDGSTFGVTIRYSEPAHETGVIGAIKSSLEQLPSGTRRSFVLAGDVITDTNYTGLRKAHEDSWDRGFTPLFTPVGMLTRFGTILPIVANPGTELQYSQMLGKQLQDCFIFYAERDLAKFIPREGDYEVLRELPFGDQGVAFVHKGYFKDVGTPEDLRAAQDKREYRVWKPSSMGIRPHSGNPER